jgi:hypothetical protein
MAQWTHCENYRGGTKRFEEIMANIYPDLIFKTEHKHPRSSKNSK